ncbi:MAG: methyltransferase domain-containing protein [Ignavibacteriaceae bacterium]|nr:methyltransferase domain-containing protein [Ignavibacteriaceae bacterium]
MEYLDLSDYQKIQVAKGFDATPELIPFILYLLQDLFELGSSPETIIEILDSLHLNKKAKVLDLACGKGAVSIQIAQRLGFSCKGIDLFKPFFEIAREKALEAGVNHLCQFEVMDINNAVEKERDYDVVILASAESLLGEVNEAIGFLRKCIRKGGYIIYDGAYLNENSIITNPDYSVFKNYKETLKQLTSCGDEIISEMIVPSEETMNINNTYTDAIRVRANELALIHPDKKKLFLSYVEKQEEECSIIEKEITGCVWCIKKTG